MHIEIHLFPNSFSIHPETFTHQMTDLMSRIEEVILKATVTSKGFAKGKTTLLDTTGDNYVLATIDIRGKDS
jgi:hypothetical protein